jgi:hypothetical protein
MIRNQAFDSDFFQIAKNLILKIPDGIFFYLLLLYHRSPAKKLKLR